MTIDSSKLPKHVAITMDGNGRWATQRKLPRTSGHNEGLKTAKRIVKAAADLGIESLTLYVFSTENWKRAEQEVGFLMNLIHTHLKGELQFYKDNKIRINHIGDMSALPKNIQKDLKECMEDTKDFTKIKLNLAINYGGRDEILRGVKNALSQGVDFNSLNEADFSKYLDMPECSDVDLLIRTGGDLRLSNFLLWHVAYAEMIFTDTLWPDYSNEEFISHIESFTTRERRFGAEKAKK
ncbi:polyprenyl diphosphate synthase [Treponema sp. C6A8]|uniref:polyprenyl diphosphate synthase n=1 Tax=Treponema sp. C6A8 TaxID=1410609 RepID=UPI000486F2AF|nr:polyprenyl diphosphate synthase [Treponema sp. C6A8]